MRTDLAWDGDHLVLAEDKVAKVARTYLSPSSFTALRSCPARHAADRLVERRDHAFGAAEMGTAAHLVLEELFTLEPQERTKATARHILSAVLGTNTDLFPENLATPTQRHAWAGAVWVRVRGLWQIESPMSVRVRRTEWPIGDSGRRPDDRPPEELRKVLLGDVSFVGVVDRTDWVDVFDDHENKVDEGCEVTDYKSGKGKRTVNPRWTDDHGDQIRLYAAAIEALDGRPPVRGRISYTKEGFSRYIDVSPAAVDKSVESLNRVWVELGRQAADNSFETRPSGLCPWCPLVSSCPAAAREGRDQPASQDGTVLQVPKVRRHRLRTAESDANPGTVDLPGAPAAPAAVADTGEADPINDFPDDPAATEPAPAPEPVPQPVAASSGDPSGTGAAPPTVPSTVRPSDSVGGTDMLTEAKPWEATAGGSLNPASYSSMAVFGTVSMAVKRLAEASQPITGTTVRSLAGTYAHIVETVQTEFTGGTSPQDGMNTRLRGALHTAIETIPEPFGGDADAWNTWVDQVTKRVRAITKAAIALFDDGPGEEPWLNLATPVEVDQAA